MSRCRWAESQQTKNSHHREFKLRTLGIGSTNNYINFTMSCIITTPKYRNRPRVRYQPDLKRISNGRIREIAFAEEIPVIHYRNHSFFFVPERNFFVCIFWEILGKFSKNTNIKTRKIKFWGFEWLFEVFRVLFSVFRVVLCVLGFIWSPRQIVFWTYVRGDGGGNAPLQDRAILPNPRPIPEEGTPHSYRRLAVGGFVDMK